jgi:hypothetical protein
MARNPGTDEVLQLRAELAAVRLFAEQAQKRRWKRKRARRGLPRSTPTYWPETRILS